jgi:hypothetical protein
MWLMVKAFCYGSSLWMKHWIHHFELQTTTQSSYLLEEEVQAYPFSKESHGPCSLGCSRDSFDGLYAT